MSHLALFVLLGLLGGAVSKPNARPEDELAIIKKITVPAKNTIRPAGETKINVNAFLRDIVRVDPDNQEIKINAIIRMSWSDPRLAYTGGNFEYVTIEEPSKIWMPVPYFASATDTGKVDPEAQMVRVFPNGTVLFSHSRQMTVRCSPDFASKLGTGKAQCPVQITSYGYTSDKLKFTWRQHTPVQFMPTLKTKRPNVQLVDFLPKNCDATTSTGTYSCIQGVIVLKGKQVADSCIPVVYKPVTHV